MDLKAVLCIVALAVLLVDAAVLRDDEDILKRQKRTLGLLTAGGQALSAGVGTAGTIATSALAAASAAKPLIVLGLGKYALWRFLSRNRNPAPVAPVPVNPGIGFNAYVNAGPPQVVPAPAGAWIEGPREPQVWIENAQPQEVWVQGPSVSQDQTVWLEPQKQNEVAFQPIGQPW